MKLAIQGRAVGSVVMSAFGFVWASLGVSGLPGAGFLTAVSAGTSVALIVAAVHLHRSVESLPAHLPRNVNPGKVIRRFRIIGIAEGVAIGIAVIVLVRLGYPQWIPAVVALIVGLHFFPLAPLFRTRIYYVTGASHCAVFGLTVAAALLYGGEILLALVPGLGSAFALWGTAGLLVAYGLKQRRKLFRRNHL